MPRGLCREKV
jgi:hypothetical protein